MLLPCLKGLTGNQPGHGSLTSPFRHPDPSQLWFQLNEIVGEQTYLRHGVVEVHDDGAGIGKVSGLLEEHGFRVAVEQEPDMRGTGIHMLYGRQP